MQTCKHSQWSICVDGFIYVIWPPAKFIKNIKLYIANVVATIIYEIVLRLAVLETECKIRDEIEIYSLFSDLFSSNRYLISELANFAVF